MRSPSATLVERLTRADRASLGPAHLVDADALERLSAEADAVFELWDSGGLHADDAASLSKLVRVEGAWRDAFCAWIRRRAREVSVTVWDADLVAGVASDVSDEGATVWLRVPRPHLRDDLGDPAVVVSAHRDGTLWTTPGVEGATAPERVVVPYGAPSHTWVDAVVGEVCTAITERRPGSLEQRERAVDDTEAVALDEARAVPPQALALSKDLARDPFVASLDRASRAFRDGDEGPEVEALTAWAALALRARASLDVLAARDDGRLIDALLDADAALDPHSDALLLLDDATWTRLTRHAALDVDTWWGRRAGLSAVPRSVWQSASSTGAAVIPLRSRRVRRSSGEGRYLAVAAATRDRGGAQGFVAEVLLPVVSREGDGRVARLRVAYEPTAGMRGSDTRFCHAAGEALHDAFLAAESVCGRRARYPWEDHSVVVELIDSDSRSLEVDGASLGLAAALAFVSCWTEHRVRDGVAASARVVGRAIAPVDQVERKRDALSRRFSGAFTLLVHADDAAGGDDDRLRAVATLREALTAAGLPSSVSSFEPVAGSIASRASELERLTRSVETQQITAFEGLGVEPWRVLAERIVWLCDSLAGDDPTASVERARSLAALSFVHAGDLQRAGEELRKVADVDDPAVALLRSIVQLSAEIDAQELLDARARDWTVADALSTTIDARLASINARTQVALRGQALGTQGRALLHARRFGEAIARLEAAWAHHRDALPREALRSSVALSMALREAGRAREARAALDAGYERLDACRAFSRDYAESCEMFWSYERGRVLLSLVELEGAREALDDALDLSRDRGWWPRVGILRALAWLDALSGDDAARAARVEEIERVAGGVSEPLRGFVARMIAEARGDWREGREVY